MVLWMSISQSRPSVWIWGIFIFNMEGFDCILKRFMIKLSDTDNVDQIMMKKT